MINKLYVDFETNALSYYDPKFKVTLTGYQFGGIYPNSKVVQHEQFELPFDLTTFNNIVGWGNYEYFVTKSQTPKWNFNFTNLKIPYHLYNENKKWGLGTALEHIGKLNHKFLRSQWEKLGYNWANVPMQYLKPYNKLDVMCMEWLDKFIQGKYSQKQNVLLQEVNQYLCELSWKGLRIDLTENKKQYKQYKQLTDQQHKELLNKFNINWNSPEQVGNVFHKAGINLPKTKTGQWAVNKTVLSNIEHPLIKEYLAWNRNMTLMNTFVIGIHDKVQLDGRLHPNFSFATTGRYRCSGPNLQNLPKPDKAPMRNQIIPDTDDSILYAVDWEQLEPHLIACFFPLKKLIEELKNGIDIYMKGVNKFNIPRHDSKQCTLATFYGATKYALKKHNLDPDSTGQQFINFIHSEYPDLRERHEEIKKASEIGQFTSVFDRTRRSNKFTELNNFRIQGPAGDLNKMMLIKTNELGRSYDSRPILDIHDELLFSVKKSEEKEYLTNVIQKSYNNINDEVERWFGFRLPLDLKYKIKKGNNYGELK